MQAELVEEINGGRQAIYKLSESYEFDGEPITHVISSHSYPGFVAPETMLFPYRPDRIEKIDFTDLYVTYPWVDHGQVVAEWCAEVSDE